MVFVAKPQADGRLVLLFDSAIRNPQFALNSPWNRNFLDEPLHERFHGAALTAVQEAFRDDAMGHDRSGQPLHIVRHHVRPALH